MKRIASLGVIAGAALATGLLAAPAATAVAPETPAPATPHVTLTSDTSCEVSGGSLVWGAKESFRSYITSTIANGGWEVSDGAGYETPSFNWTGATGEIDSATGAGEVSFTGSITFTGHGGILNMVMANPTIRFAEDGSATLLIDTRSNDTSGNLAVDVQQGELASLALPSPLEAATGPVSYADVPAALTEAGVPAFGAFYQAGDALDPVTFSFELDCATATAPTEEPKETAAPEEPEVTAQEETADPGVPWLPIIIGGAAVVVVAVAAGLLIAGRKRAGGAGGAGNDSGGDVSA